MKEEKALNIPDPTWSDSLVDVLKRSLFSSDKGDLVETKQTTEKEPSIQWSDAGDIWENFWKGSVSRGADYALKPWELLADRNLSKDIGVPDYEDWDVDYRTEFEEGPYGWLRHLDKASYGTGILGALGAYSTIGRIPGVGSTIAGVAYPGWRYIGRINQMNKIMKMKRAIDSGVVPKGGILNAIKDFGKSTGQFIGRPFRQINPKRWFKSFDKYEGPYDYKGKPIWAPKSEKLTSYPERSLTGNLLAGTAILRGADLTKSLIREAKADEMDIDVPRGIETAYPDRIMRMARTKDPGLEVTIPLPYTQ